MKANLTRRNFLTALSPFLISGGLFWAVKNLTLEKARLLSYLQDSTLQNSRKVSLPENLARGSEHYIYKGESPIYRSGSVLLYSDRYIANSAIVTGTDGNYFLATPQHVVSLLNTNEIYAYIPGLGAFSIENPVFDYNYPAVRNPIYNDYIAYTPLVGDMADDVNYATSQGLIAPLNFCSYQPGENEFCSLMRGDVGEQLLRYEGPNFFGDKYIFTSDKYMGCPGISGSPLYQLDEHAVPTGYIYGLVSSADNSSTSQDSFGNMQGPCGDRIYVKPYS